MKKLIAFILATICLITDVTGVQAASLNHVHNYSIRGESIVKEGFECCTVWCKCGKHKDIRLKFVMTEHQVEIKLGKLIKAEKTLVKGTSSAQGKLFCNFVQMLSDSIFLDQPNRVLYDVDKVKIGDIVYLTDGTEGIVIKKSKKEIYLAGTDCNGETFYNGKYQRKLIDTMVNCIITRY